MSGQGATGGSMSSGAMGSANAGGTMGSTASGEMNAGGTMGSAMSGNMNAGGATGMAMASGGGMQPIPDTAENRARYGQPESASGKRTMGEGPVSQARRAGRNR
jgi:hypothetical protein